ncbi:MAG: OmpA family protein [Pseudomonadota bacterium]
MKRFLLFCSLWALPAQADILTLPGTPRFVSSQDIDGPFALPTGPWNNGVPRLNLAGDVHQQVIYLNRNAGVFKVLETLATQLKDQGYDSLLTCRDRACGGFDFRYAVPVPQPPDFFVDLGHYGFVSALHPNGAAAMVFISRTQDNIHLSLTTITPAQTDAIATVGTVPPPLTLSQALTDQGRFILSDLTFDRGSSALDATGFASLVELSAYLSANPQRTIALVGHTDATGALQANITLSRERARAVRDVMVTQYGVAADRIIAEGVGYLAPIADNRTDEGRAMNRRVEVVVTGTR